MHDIYLAKNSDYGLSFDRSCNEFGMLSPIIRMQDKLNRLKSLYNKSCSQESAKVIDESVSDTLLDLANYAILTVMWKNRTK